MKVLFLSPWFPFPPANGSELRIHALLRGLAARHDVTLISFQRRPITPEGLTAARRMLSAVHLVPWRDFDPASLRSRLGFFSSRPRSIVDTYSVEMAGLISQEIETGRYDVVVAAQLTMAAYWPCFQSVPAVLEEIELGIYMPPVPNNGSVNTILRQHLMWAKLCAYVRGLLPRFAAVTVVSGRERAILKQITSTFETVRIVPNGVDLANRPIGTVIRNPQTLIFAGAFTYDVNYEAMEWFTGRVFPLVRQELPNTRLIITGDHAGKVLPSVENVTLTGYIEDIQSAVAGAAVSIAPILQGGGTRLKILEAMALGTPVVSTTKGAEGLDAVDGRDILLADTPEAFAAAVLRLLRDLDLRQNLVNNACDLIRRQYDWNIILPEFLELVEKVAVDRAVTMPEVQPLAATPRDVHPLPGTTAGRVP